MVDAGARWIGAGLVAVWALCGCTTSGAPIDLEVYPYDGARGAAFEVFDRYVGFRGLAVYGTEEVCDGDLLHVAHVLAQYLDNDEDGEADSSAVHGELFDRSAAMVVFGAPDDADATAFFDADLPEELAVQDLYADEIHPGGAAEELFDATLEETLHLVTTWGYAQAFPVTFAESPGSAIAAAMDLCIEAGHYDPLIHEPDMPYAHQVTEYHYWAQTSILGAQEYPGRPEEIADEWALYSANLVEQEDPTVFALLSDPQWGLPIRLPDGSYESPPPS